MLSLQGKVLAVAVRQLAQTPPDSWRCARGELLPTDRGLRNGGVTCAVSLAFSFMIQGAPSSAVKISGVRWWLTRGRMQPVIWRCTAAGDGEESTVIFLIQT